MLDSTQECVGCGQSRPLRLGQVLLLCEPGEHDQCLGRTYPRLPPAVLELKRLNDEFDFANAPWPQLDVKAAHPPRLFPVDLFFGSPDSLERVRQRIPREDRVAHHIQEVRYDLFTAGRGPRANKRLSLPVMSAITVVIGGAFDLRYHLAIATIGTEPKVDAIHSAFARAAPDQLNYALGHCVEELLVADGRRAAPAVPGRFSVTRKQKEKIDVGSIVQLATAELAERYDCELGFFNATALIVSQRRTVKVDHFLVCPRQGVVENHIREV